MSDAGGGFRAPGPHRPESSGPDVPGHQQPGQPPAGAGGSPSAGSGSVPPGASSPTNTGRGPGAPAWSQRPPDFRPGVVPLRPLALGDLYSGVIATIRGNLQATIGAGMLVGTLVLAVLTPLGLLVTRWQLDTTPSTPADPTTVEVRTTFGEQIPNLAGVVTPVVLAAFLAYVVSQAVLGNRVGLGQTWRATRGRLLPVLGSVVVAFVAYAVLVAVVLVGPLALLLGSVDSGSDSGSVVTAVLLIIGGVLVTLVVLAFFWTRWAFVAPAIVLERVGVFAGFRRSWSLTSGRPFWRIFGLRLLTTLIVSIAGYVLTIPIAVVGFGVIAATGFDPETLSMASLVMNALSVLVAAALTTPFSSGFDSLLYIDERIRREALDVTLIQATSRPTAHPGGAPGAPA